MLLFSKRFFVLISVLVLAPGLASAVCGDGIVEPAEECDDGNLDVGDGCDDLCLVEAGFVCDGEPSSCGTLQERDLVPDSGDALVTFDELTGLEWLDVPETQGISFDELAGDQDGFLTQGWRQAVGAEVCDIFTNFALAPETCPGPEREIIFQDFASFLLSFLGVTAMTPSDQLMNGTYDDSDTGSIENRIGTALLELVDPNVSRALIADDQLSPELPVPQIGHMLVRVAGPCGDLDENDSVEVADMDILRMHLVDPEGMPLTETEQMRCTTIGEDDDACGIRDVAAGLRATAIPPAGPVIPQTCAAGA